MAFWFDEEVGAILVKLTTGDYEVTLYRERKRFANLKAAMQEVNIAAGNDPGTMIAIDMETFAELVSHMSIS